MKIDFVIFSLLNKKKLMDAATTTKAEKLSWFIDKECIFPFIIFVSFCHIEKSKKSEKFDQEGKEMLKLPWK